MKDYKIDLMEKTERLFLFFSACPQQKRRFSAQNGKFQSKLNKLCETNPIFKTPKILVSIVASMTTNKKLRTMNSQKRTQTNPILKGSEVEDKYKFENSSFPDKLSDCITER
jgi:hypothetical protein